MKKVFGLFVLALFAASSAFAVPSRVGKTDIGVNVSAAIPDGDGDTAAYVGGNLSHGINEWLAVGFSGGWAQFDESEAGISIEETAVPLFGDLIFRVPMPDSPAQPYGIVGLGVILWDVDDNLPTVEVDVDEAFAVKLGGGVDWFINENWALNFEATYVISDADATARNTTNGASVSIEADTDFWMIGGGVKYLFS